MRLMERTRLLQARLTKFWTLEEAAERIGVDINTLHRWERGKATPRAYNLQRLCDIYGMSVQELGLEDDPTLVIPVASSKAVEDSKEVESFIGHDLTMRLLALAFTSHQSYQELQVSLTRIIGEYHTMNTGNTADLTRREALCRLATLPFIAFHLNAPKSLLQHTSDEVLNQYAASIAACWELSRSDDESDIAVAFRCITVYASTLKVLLDSVSKGAQRKAMANLISQCALLQTVLGWHFTGLKEATQHGQEAVKYSQVADDISLQLSALKCLAWTCYYDHRNTQALQNMEQAVLLVNEHKASLPVYVHSNIYSTLALMQARNGQEVSASLRYAEKTALHDSDYPVYVDPPLPAFIRNAGMALYQQRLLGQSLDLLSQVVDPVSLKAKYPMPERTRIEVINVMTLASLKSAKKDKDQTLYLWSTGIQGAKSIKSEQRFNEALAAYDIMETFWSDEKDVKELRAHITHW